MKDKRRLLLVLVLMIAALLAFFLRDLFSVYIVAPAAKFLFVMRGYYAATGQETYWQIVAVIVVLIGLLSLHLVDFNLLATPFERTRGNGEAAQGEVAHLAFWLENVQRSSQAARGRRQGSYAQWTVARSLATLAVDLLNRQGEGEEREKRLQGPGWSPPANIQTYLEIGLRSNPVMFKQKIAAARIAIPEVEEVIRYLESYVESTQ